MARTWAVSRIKRAADAGLAVVGGVALSPLLLGCALVLRWRDGTPILFRQPRVGAGGRLFSIVKFRTMRPEPGGAQVTTASDPRVTPLGRVLRRFKLDELPQLWNVVRGEMSFVGPRPEVPVYADRHAAAFRRLSDLRPGITDWSSLSFRDEERLLSQAAGHADFYIAVLLPRKLALARLYRRHASPVLDVRLILATLAAIAHLERVVLFFAGPVVLHARRGLLEPRTLRSFKLHQTVAR